MRKELITLFVLMTLSLLLVGCESDSTAPNEDLPPLESQDVATQSGAMATSMMQALPRIWDPTTNKAIGEYQYSFFGGFVTGTVFSEFRDTEGGNLVDHGVAGWARIYTEDPLVVTLFDDGIPWLLGFDIEADIDQALDQAIANGSGSLTVGDYLATFTVSDVVVAQGSDYPTSGTISFTSGGITATVTFNGSGNAAVTVGDDSWIIDLDNGSISG